MKKFGSIVLLCLLLCACSVFSTVSPTSTPTPTKVPATNTPDPIQYPDMDWESILFQDGDLPGSYEIEVNIDDLPYTFQRNNIPEPAFAVTLLLDRVAISGIKGGWVALSIYDDQSALKSGYSKVVEKGEPFVSEPITMKIYSSSVKDTNISWVEVAFTQCSALVVIFVDGTEKKITGVTYATQLVDRLGPVVCE